MATSSQAPSVARLRTHQSGRLSLVSSFRGKLVATHFWDFCNTTGTKLTCRLPATPSPGQSSMIAGDRMGCCCRFGVFPHSCNTWCFATRRALSVVPTYDDVSYLVDGLHRLKAFDVAGFRGLFRSLAIEPAHDRPTPACLGAQSRVRHKLNSQFAPEKPAEIGSKMPKALIVDGIHPKSCRCHAPLLFTSGN